MRFWTLRNQFLSTASWRLIFMRLSSMGSSIFTEESTELHYLKNGPNFINLQTRKLPTVSGTNVVQSVRNACFFRVNPTPLDNPKLIIFSKDALDLIDFAQYFTDNEMSVRAEQLLTLYMSGSQIWERSDPVAHCYCGYQFGSFAGQLGDGAAISLGEVLNRRGEQWDLQLKGAGLTPFSRQADGRKVLRSSIREFLCSEAMHYLGIPTTRAATVITSDTLVERDMFYSGNNIMERATVISRIAPTFIRFGSFEIARTKDSFTHLFGPSVGNPKIIAQLTDFVIEHFYPELWAERDDTNIIPTYLAFFKQVVQLTAILVAHWQTVGFCHGVLNTDNMSIIGLTIDYGPFGFMDQFKWDHVCNTSDYSGRYAYATQPTMCMWNCMRLADSLIQAITADLHDTDSDLKTQFHGVLEETFMPTYNKFYLDKMRNKLGLSTARNTDTELVNDLFNTMEKTGADFTNTFLAIEDTLEREFSKRTLSRFNANDNNAVSFHFDFSNMCDLLINECCNLTQMLDSLEPGNMDTQIQLMANLFNIPERYLDNMEADKVLKSGERAKRVKEFETMTEPEKRTHVVNHWSKWLQSYFSRLQIDEESNPELDVSKRLTLMRANNPRIVLRNHLAEEVIKAAESGDYSVLKTLFNALRDPFKEPNLTTKMNISNGGINNKDLPSDSMSQPDLCSYAMRSRNRIRPPDWARKLRVSCSS